MDQGFPMSYKSAWKEIMPLSLLAMQTLYTHVLIQLHMPSSAFPSSAFPSRWFLLLPPPPPMLAAVGQRGIEELTLLIHTCMSLCSSLLPPRPHLTNGLVH